MPSERRITLDCSSDVENEKDRKRERETKLDVKLTADFFADPELPHFDSGHCVDKDVEEFLQQSSKQPQKQYFETNT